MQNYLMKKFATLAAWHNFVLQLKINFFNKLYPQT